MVSALLSNLIFLSQRTFLPSLESHSHKPLQQFSFSCFDSIDTNTLLRFCFCQRKWHNYLQLLEFQLFNCQQLFHPTAIFKHISATQQVSTLCKKEEDNSFFSRSCFLIMLLCSLCSGRFGNFTKQMPLPLDLVLLWAICQLFPTSKMNENIGIPLLLSSSLFLCVPTICFFSWLIILISPELVEQVFNLLQIIFT